MLIQEKFFFGMWFLPAVVYGLTTELYDSNHTNTFLDRSAQIIGVKAAVFEVHRLRKALNCSTITNVKHLFVYSIAASQNNIINPNIYEEKYVVNALVQKKMRDGTKTAYSRVKFLQDSNKLATPSIMDPSLT